MNSDEYVNIEIPELVILEHDRKTGMVKAQRYDDGHLVETEIYPHPIPPENTKEIYTYWPENTKEIYPYWGEDET